MNTDKFQLLIDCVKQRLPSHVVPVFQTDCPDYEKDDGVSLELMLSNYTSRELRRGNKIRNPAGDYLHHPSAARVRLLRKLSKREEERAQT